MKWFRLGKSAKTRTVTVDIQKADVWAELLDGEWVLVTGNLHGDHDVKGVAPMPVTEWFDLLSNWEHTFITCDGNTLLIAVSQIKKLELKNIRPHIVSYEEVYHE